LKHLLEIQNMTKWWSPIYCFRHFTVLEESGSYDSLFSLFSDWLFYKTGRQWCKQWASRLFQNTQTVKIAKQTVLWSRSLRR